MLIYIFIYRQKSPSDKINKYFWKNCKWVVGTRAVDEKGSTYKTEVELTKYLGISH